MLPSGVRVSTATTLGLGEKRCGAWIKFGTLLGHCAASAHGCSKTKQRCAHLGRSTAFRTPFACRQRMHFAAPAILGCTVPSWQLVIDG